MEIMDNLFLLGRRDSNMYVKNVKKYDTFVPEPNSIINRIMLRSKNNNISFDEKVECRVIDKITLRYDSVNSLNIVIDPSYIYINSNKICLPEIQFKDLRERQIIEFKNMQLSDTQRTFLERNIIKDIDLDIDTMLLEAISSFHHDYLYHGYLNKHVMLGASHTLRETSGLCVKNIVCSTRYSYYNELFEYSKDEISKFNINILPKSDILLRERDNISDFFMFPKKNKFGAFYLNNKHTGERIYHFNNKYSLLEHVSLGICFFNDISYVKVCALSL